MRMLKLNFDANFEMMTGLSSESIISSKPCDIYVLHAEDKPDLTRELNLG